MGCATSPSCSAIVPDAEATAIAPRCQLSTSGPRVTSMRTGLTMTSCHQWQSNLHCSIGPDQQAIKGSVALQPLRRHFSGKPKPGFLWQAKVWISLASQSLGHEKAPPRYASGARIEFQGPPHIKRGNDEPSRRTLSAPFRVSERSCAMRRDQRSHKHSGASPCRSTIHCP